MPMKAECNPQYICQKLKCIGKSSTFPYCQLNHHPTVSFLDYKMRPYTVTVTVDIGGIGYRCKG